MFSFLRSYRYLSYMTLPSVLKSASGTFVLPAGQYIITVSCSDVVAGGRKYLTQQGNIVSDIFISVREQQYP